MKISKELIDQRETKLEATRLYLKREFVGIDEIIDKFIDSIRIWYLLPEIQTRPLIVNLWGITGVGKTDLVRKFVNFTKFADRFCEIQMDSRDGSATVQDYLEMTFDNGDQQGILLLDEIQRFRSVDEDGKENNSAKYQDVWMLLSDGTFQSNSKIKKSLIQMILEDEFWADHRDDDDDDDDEVTPIDADVTESKKKRKKKFKYQTYYWDAARLKKLLRTSEEVSDIMKWSQEKKIMKIKERLASQEVFEGTKYSRLLIIVSGNLDEAFTMSGTVEDADRNADVYHEYSKTINIIQIKKALTRRFKPEQIARLGNVHLIYPILSKAGYHDIIVQKAAAIIKNVKDKHKINIALDKSVYEVIYANGVFPTQGVRPLLSTISSILENSLPTFIFEHMRGTTRKKINIKYDNNGFLTSTINGKTIKHSIPRVLDDIKSKQTIDHKTLIAVHEAGHAVAYAILYKTSPTQIVTSTTNYESAGFVGMHHTLGAKEDCLDDIQVTFAGRAAEDLVFGENHITAGAMSDYSHATLIAGQIVRTTGMDKSKGYYVPPNSNKGFHLHDINKTDGNIETILEAEYKNSENLIKENTLFLLEVADNLIDKSNLLPKEFKVIADKYIKGGITLRSAKDTIEQPFNEKLQEFKARHTLVSVDPSKIKKTSV